MTPAKLRGTFRLPFPALTVLRGIDARAITTNDKGKIISTSRRQPLIKIADQPLSIAAANWEPNSEHRSDAPVHPQLRPHHAPVM